MPRAGWWWCMGLLAGTAKADPVDPFTEPDESELLEAEARVVTVASRYAQGSARASSIITVITASELRERGYRSLADALGNIPGVYITISSDDNNKVLLLVDGVPWADGLYNHAWIDEYLSLSMVRQVEVIRGPTSTTYGANAFAAVINVVTYSPGELRGGFARGDVGSFARRGVSVVFGDRLGEGDDEVGVRLYARALSTDGDGVELLPDGSQDVAGASPRRAMSAGLLLQHRGLSVRFDHVDYRHAPLLLSEDSALGALVQDPDLFAYQYQDDFAAARWALDLSHAVVLTPELYWQRYDDPGRYASVSDTDADGDGALESTLVEADKLTARYGASLQAELRPALNHVTVLGVGVDATQLLSVVDRTFYDSSALPFADTFNAPPVVLANAYGVVQHHWTPLWWVEGDAGLRFDRRNYYCLADEDSCTEPDPLPFLSPRAGVSVVPGNGVGFKATYGRAFRAPDARELFVDVGHDGDGANLATASNPALAPEVIDSVEAEVSMARLGPVSLRLDGFASRIRDEIDKVRGEDDVLGDVWYANRAGSNVVGAEAEAGFNRGPWEVTGTASWTRTVDIATGLEGYGFPPVMGHGRVGWSPVDGLKLSLLGDYIGRRPTAAWSPDAGLPDGDPYALLHFAIATDGLVDGRVRADLSVRNVLNTAYSRPLYRDEVNALDADGEAANPFPLEGEERNIIFGVEVAF